MHVTYLANQYLLWTENGSFVHFDLRMPHLKSHLTPPVHATEVQVSCNKDDNNHGKYCPEHC
jgi:hypothetical protein